MTELADHFRGHGYAVVPSIGRDPDQPWMFVHELAGRWPEMVERQSIRPTAAAKSFAGSAAFTPFHTDSQDFLGAPPGLQIMVCRRSCRCLESTMDRHPQLHTTRPGSKYRLC